MEDKSFRLEELILEGLKGALASPGEHRLYRAGKFDGLFPSKLGASLEAAELALKQDYLRTVRTETRGTIRTEWVSITPRGVEFVYKNDSPRAVLSEMRKVLLSAAGGLPGAIEQFHAEQEKLQQNFETQMKTFAKELETLTTRVEESLRRLEATGPLLAEKYQQAIPWAYDALVYLDRRKATGAKDPATLPELWEALAAKHKLEIPQFHDGLKQLRDAGAVELLPVPITEIDRPEFACIDHAEMIYRIRR